MKRHLTTILLCSGILAAAGMAWAYSDGQKFEGKTGAPGESTCADCHGNLNTGSGSASITLSDDEYAPGDIVVISVSVQQTGQERWGFELTVLDGSDQPAGEIVVTDPDRTLLSTDGTGRQYIKHTSQGTDAGTPDISPGWSFQWVAPDPGLGTVTFYMAGIAANDGSGANGDFTYTTSSEKMQVDINDPLAPQLPDHFSLSQNYPNPFNPTTTIEYYLPRQTHIEIVVLNVLGQKVRVLHEGVKPFGSHTVYWDGTDSRGVPVAGGIYYYRLKAGDFVDTKPMILLK